MRADTVSRLDASLKALVLPRVLACYCEQAERARKEGLGYEEYLADLLEQEWEVRQGKRIERLLRESHLPLEKSLSSFERARLTTKLAAQLDVLLAGEFLDSATNVLAFGTPGAGKSHLLCALGQELVYRGRRVLFRRCDLLVQDLLAAKKELRLERFLKSLRRYEAIVVDDLCYMQQSQEEMEVLFSLFADRYERASVLLSSNLAFSEWQRVFKDPMTTAAAIDRLVHHSVILELNLPSYRLEQARKRSGGRSPEGQAAPQGRGSVEDAPAGATEGRDGGSDLV
jgi:DNA replication protein DnaC